MDTLKVLVEVRGGNVSSIYASDPAALDIEILDLDNAEEDGDYEPSEAFRSIYNAAHEVA